MRRKHHTALYTRVQKRFIAVFRSRLPDSQGRDVREARRQEQELVRAQNHSV
jgi:hypothetical protein